MKKVCLFFILICMAIVFQYSLRSNAGEGDSAEFLQNLSDVPCAQSYNPYVTPPYCGGYCPLDYACSLNKTASGCVCIYTGHVCADDSECPNCESCGGGPSFVFVTGGLPSSQCIGTASELERINANLIRACCCGTSPLYGGEE